jgi:hypothetical protein
MDIDTFATLALLAYTPVAGVLCALTIKRFSNR